MEEVDTTRSELTEERLRLEREALAIERERLAAARAHAEAMARISRPGGSWMRYASIVLLALACFATGLIAGIAIMERQQQNELEERRERALSLIKGISNEGKDASATNSPSAETGRNVKVVVIQ